MDKTISTKRTVIFLVITMSFRFNFSGCNTVNESEICDKEEIKWLKSEEILPTNQIKYLDDLVTHAQIFSCGDTDIGHVVANEALANISESSENASKLAKDENSDLVPGKYEGGLKIWECTHDLVEYLIENKDEINFNDAKVLDLGCGAGILGIYAFLNGAIVTFQDYNKEVLEYVTIPNVLLNIEEDDSREKEIKKCKFYSGDWALFDQKLGESTVFDVILTSETIYNENNYNKLIQLFTRRVMENGKIYVAAKTCYFGVGGSVKLFESYVNKSGILNCEVCWTNDSGIQRKILKITRK